MAGIQELIREEANSTISFGNHLMDEKKKIINFDIEGHLYKVKTYNEITRLEKDGKLLFESVPGTTVYNLYETDKMMQFNIEGIDDAQITLELEAEQDYKIFIEQVQVGKMKSNLGGKINFSVDFSTKQTQNIMIKKA